MAFMNQERKKELAPAIKAVFKKYNVKGSISVRNYSTLVVTIKSGKLDFRSQYLESLEAPEYYTEEEKENYYYWNKKRKEIDINIYHLDKRWSGKCAAFLEELDAAMSQGNWNNSDIQTDYFDVGWYKDINIGSYKKAYELI